MNLENIENLESFYTILNRDENGRKIESYLLEDCQFVKNHSFYPSVIIYSEKNEKYYNPINEKTLSLEKLTVFKQIDFTLIKTNSVETNPVFFFIYNTDNYYHFIYDSIPYLISFFELKKKVSDLKLLINYPNNQTNMIYKFVSEFFDIVGINKNDLLIAEDNKVYKKIFISTSFTHGIDSNLPPRKEVYDFFKKIVESQSSKFDLSYPKKIYISRRSWKHNDYSNIGTNYTTKRRMVNEDDLVNLLEKNGFEEIFTEKLNTLEKFNLFYNAESVVGAIGGGICNVLFSKPETRLISIVSPTFLEVNKRFKYSLDKVKTIFFSETKHVENTKFKTGMRVQCKDLSIIGEISKVSDTELTILYSNHDVAGWNNQIEFNKIQIPIHLCENLDNGLNSPFEIDIKGFEQLFFSN